ncbi:hypothetical protein BH11PSE11_BH11PSE11_05380 [soil metagenome]
MKTSLYVPLLASSIFLISAALASPANAHHESSALSALSALPVASLVVGSAGVGSVVALPSALVAGGAVLIVKTVEVSARGTLYVLERASDGVELSVEIAGNTARSASMVAGATVTASVISAGVVLSAAGQVIAFIPNELGLALMHTERLSN